MALNSTSKTRTSKGFQSKAGSKSNRPIGGTDIRQTITNRIISIMEKGTQEWRKTWTTAARTGVPTNASTGQQYRGINVLILWAEAQEQGYKSGKWLTYRQAAALGGQVRKGEKATACVYFEMIAKNGKEITTQPTIQDDDQPGFFPMIKSFCVFNVDQIDNLPTSVTAQKAPEDKAFDPIPAAEIFIKNVGADIRHGGDRAAFSPSGNYIVMPQKEVFKCPENYYATALHELTHWTGHESRLNRTFGKRFGDQAYALEELVAELGSAFLAGKFGFVDATIENHASYLSNWIEVLKTDKAAIFAAAGAAGKAFDFLTAMQQSTVIKTTA